MENNSLQHFGVMGMKWGVRKDAVPKGVPTVGRTIRGNYGKSEMYKNENAKAIAKVREDARKETFAYVGGTLGSILVRQIAKTPQVKNGATIAASIFGMAAIGSKISEDIFGVTGAIMEIRSRKK